MAKETKTSEYSIAPTSHIEISSSAFKNNIRYLRKAIGDKVRLSSVVKGNAYGHDIEKIVPLAEKEGINHFSVYSAHEAYSVWKVMSPKSKVMIMGMIEQGEPLTWAIKEGIEFYVFDFDRLESTIQTARVLGKKAMIHIDIETGFHRTGFEIEELPVLVAILKDNTNYLELCGVCTHYAGAESVANYLRVTRQIEEFKRACNIFTESNLRPHYFHSACSAAALIYPQSIMDMVRIGIVMYGFWPSQETYVYRYKQDTEAGHTIKRTLSWKSKVMVVKSVKAGEFIGYGTSYLANRDMRVAIVPVGYTNGFSRSLSNNGRVLIRGKCVQVIGTVGMNTITIDITDVKTAETGDEVVLIGKQKKQTISVASFCEMSNLLNYQLLARLPANIPRRVVK